MDKSVFVISKPQFGQALVFIFNAWYVIIEQHMIM